MTENDPLKLISIFLWWYFLLPSICMSLSFLRFFSRQPKIYCLEFYEIFYKLFMVIVHWLDLKMIFLKWVFFNLRIWLIFKETHWRDLHHFHSVLIDFMTTSEKKTLDGSLDLEIQNPKLQTTYQANIQYRPIFSMIKLLKGSNFSKSYQACTIT